MINMNEINIEEKITMNKNIVSNSLFLIQMCVYKYLIDSQDGGSHFHRCHAIRICHESDLVCKIYQGISRQPVVVLKSPLDSVSPYKDILKVHFRFH